MKYVLNNLVWPKALREEYRQKKGVKPFYLVLLWPLHYCNGINSDMSRVGGLTEIFLGMTKKDSNNDFYIHGTQTFNF